MQLNIPSPSNPSMQEHSKEPIVLEHVASTWQALSCSHSLSSREKKREKTNNMTMMLSNQLTATIYSIAKETIKATAIKTSNSVHTRSIDMAVVSVKVFALVKIYTTFYDKNYSTSLA